ncbi:hypothetical protein BC629DRAFT_1515137, partial [Irpex lacteus]
MMPPLNTTPELSDDDRSGSVARSANRRRSTRACDQCRRTKSKCERSDVENVCRACAAMGVSCTYVGPSHKRGPPKGYILALERRLHQVEALLGTIIGSDDPRARTLVDDLARDQLAAHIIRRVKTGPFGPRGRLTQPFGSTKEDFLAAIMTGPGDESPRSSYGEENYALVSPDRDWQDRLQSLLQVSAPQTRISQPSYNQAPAASQQYALPPFRQLSSPVHHSSTQQQSHYGLQGNLGGYSTPTKHESPVSTTAMLAPLQQTQQQSVQVRTTVANRPTDTPQRQRTTRPRTLPRGGTGSTGIRGYLV